MKRVSLGQDGCLQHKFIDIPVGLPHAELMRIIYFFKKRFETFPVIKISELLCIPGYMQAVGIAQQEGAVRLFCLVKDRPPFGRQVAKDGIPGIQDLQVGDTPIKMFVQDFQKFRFLYLSGFEAEEKIFIPVMRKCFVEMTKTQVFEGEDDRIYIQVGDHTPPVKNYVLNFGNINI
jgi:hypothetical protein